jgi:hypothetical protein
MSLILELNSESLTFFLIKLNWEFLFHFLGEKTRTKSCLMKTVSTHYEHICLALNLNSWRFETIVKGCNKSLVLLRIIHINYEFIFFNILKIL